MTQSLIKTPVPVGPYTALVVMSHAVGPTLRFYPLRSVEENRAEFGDMLSDARDFVAETCCTECGMASEEADLRECRECGDTGCRCTVVEDDHAQDTFYCLSCGVPCGCRECFDA